MPLVRVSGVDAESFDTFDVAEMADHGHRNQRNSWSSRQSQTSLAGMSSGANSRLSSLSIGALTPMPEADDLVSIDSSSGRKSEEADRVGSISSRGMAGMQSHRLSHSSISVGSATSCRTTPTVSVSHSGNGDYVQSTNSSYNQPPLYETNDNLDELQNDPRNPFNSRNSGNQRPSWAENHIPEEDETSISTQDDSSQSRNHQTQQPRSNPPPHQHHQRPNRNRQNQVPSSASDLDDISVASHQSNRQDFNKKAANNNNDNSHMIQQLESLVAKLNFELATTKSSLDEIQLENRRLNADRDQLTNDRALLQEENEQLHSKIERLEKEKILRNMEGTKGVVARCVPELESSSARNGGARDKSSSINRAYVPITKQRLGKVGGGDTLEVPFRTSDSDYHLRPRRSSLCSVQSYNDLTMSDNEDLSRGDTEGHSNHSIASVALDDGMDNYDFQSSETHEQEETAQRGTPRLDLINNMLGVIKRPSVGDVSRESQKRNEASVTSQSRRNSKADIGDTTTKPSEVSSNQKDHNLKAGDGNGIDDDIGSNPQGEGEDFNDDDPFATWSERGDPKRKEDERNWLQKGLSRGNMARKAPQPNSNEMIEDPFDLSTDQLDDINEMNEQYTSFADHPSEKSGSGADDSASVMQDRNNPNRRFGLFKGFMGAGRGRGRGGGRRNS